MRLISMRAENFMKFTEFHIDFGKTTIISGMNAEGKSTILNMFTWLFFDCDNDLNSNPPVRKKGVVEDDVVVEAICEVDGTEVAFKKVQKRKWGASEFEYNDKNSYYINEVSKPLKDFNQAFGMSKDSLKICSNVNAFISQKPNDMRLQLINLVGGISDLEIAETNSELSVLANELEKYTREEVIARAKKNKSDKERDKVILTGRIKEKELDCQRVVDTTKLEEAKAECLAKIEKYEALLNDDSTDKEIEKLAEEHTSLKMKISTMHDAEYSEYMADVNALNGRYNQVTYDLNKCNQDISNIKTNIERKTFARDNIKALIDSTRDAWKIESKAKCDLKKDSFVCKYSGCDCEHIQRVVETNYEKSVAEWEKAHSLKLASLTDKGTQLKAELKSANDEIKSLEKSLTKAQSLCEKLSAEENEIVEKRNNIKPFTVSQEIVDLTEKVKEIEDKIHECKSSNNRLFVKQDLRIAKSELNTIEREISLADTSRDEQRLDELKEQMKECENSIATSIMMVDMVKRLDEIKNKLVTDRVNAMFDLVEWQLFKYTQSGNYDNTCVPKVNGMSILSTEANKANRMLGRLDIAKCLQRALGVTVPVFLDDAESFDTSNLSNALASMDCQVIMTKVADCTLDIE